MKVLSTLLLAVALGAAPQASKQSPPASSTEAMYRAAADSAERKFQHVRDNGAKSKPDETPTVFTEREINAYFAAGRVDLPKGVRRVQFTGTPGVIDTLTSVDFDEITANQPISPIWKSLFSGVHDVHVVAHGQGSGGRATIHTDSVDIDGVPVPRVALRYFLDKYVKPKHPDVDLDTTFTLPYRVDTVAVGDHELTMTQK